MTLTWTAFATPFQNQGAESLNGSQSQDWPFDYVPELSSYTLEATDGESSILSSDPNLLDVTQPLVDLNAQTLSEGNLPPSRFPFPDPFRNGAPAYSENGLMLDPWQRNLDLNRLDFLPNIAPSLSVEKVWDQETKETSPNLKQPSLLIPNSSQSPSDLVTDTCAEENETEYTSPNIFSLPLSPEHAETGPSKRTLEQNTVPPEAGEKMVKPPKKRGRKPIIRTPVQLQQRLVKQRERNRAAAGKCRKKKKEETGELATSARQMELANQELLDKRDILSLEILNLQESLIQHQHCGCCEVNQYFQQRLRLNKADLPTSHLLASPILDEKEAEDQDDQDDQSDSE